MVAVELAHQDLQLAGRLGHVDADDLRAVAVQHAGDLLADAAARTGDEGDLALERARQSATGSALVSPWAPIRTTWPET